MDYSDLYEELEGQEEGLGRGSPSARAVTTVPEGLEESVEQEERDREAIKSGEERARRAEW